MRLTLWRSIAAVSAIVLVASLEGARRPRYGGVLRVQASEAIQTLDPPDWPDDPGEATLKSRLTGLVFETLVRLDEKGRPQPSLAVSWSHDAAGKRWVFTPRTNVTLHNGAMWQPEDGTLAVADDRPIERILSELARPRNAVVVHLPDGTLAGTGPFSVARWEAGKSVTLAAHSAYWGGRPYLDSIEVQMARPERQQTLDFEAGKADAIEVAVTEVRRLRLRNANLAVSRPVEILALVFDGPRVVVPQVEQALALSIDRTAIHSVLLQRQGEASAALLPQWLSGYSFVFPQARDLARARQLAGGAPPLSLAYDRADSLARAIAERVAVNAMEAGLTIRVAAGAGRVTAGTADARVMRLRIAVADPETALDDLASQLKTPPPAIGNLYNAERALLGGGRVTPLVHLPVAWQLSSKVHGWNGEGRWEDVWLEP